MNTTETKLSIRIDKKTKDKAKKTLENLGLDLSSGVKMFLHSVINTQSIPFDVRTKNGYTLAQEKAILKDFSDLKKSISSGEKKGFSTAEELHKSIV
jgi:DNA-damage-inducible protein J